MHSQVAVGYSTSGNYWVVQNSWGTGWGEGGFVRVAMTGTSTGPCGMYQYAYKPGTSFAKTLSDIAPSSSPPPASPFPPPPPLDAQVPSVPLLQGRAGVSPAGVTV